MNNKMISRLLAIMMVVAGFSLSSCSSDDNGDKDQTPPYEGATSTTAEPIIYIKEEMFDYLDITCTIDGNAVKLTKDNTVETSYSPYLGLGAETVRQYKATKQEYTSFPAQKIVKVECKVKNDFDINTTTIEKLIYFVDVDIKYGNNKNAWSSFSISKGSPTDIELDLTERRSEFNQFKELIEYPTTKTVTFENANSVELK